MIKGIVMDLDQTLLHNDKQISRYTLQVLEQAKRQGLTLFFATGRSVMRIENYRRQVQPEGLICLNGGLNLWQGQRVSQYPLNPTLVKSVVERLNGLSGCRLTLTYAETIFTNDPQTRHDDPIYHRADLPGCPMDSVLKISINLDSDQEAAWLNSLDCTCLANAHEPGYYVLVSSVVSKLTGARDLCRRCGLDLSELAVFGDDFNDLPLLQNCGIGIAVMNAHPEVKAAASQICFSNEQDGPAHWIAEVLLKEKPEF